MAQVLSDVPTQHNAVMDLVGNQLGFVRSTNYGSVFDVIDLGSEGNSLAQTNCRITHHTDNPYRDPFPGPLLTCCCCCCCATDSNGCYGIAPWTKHHLLTLETCVEPRRPDHGYACHVGA
jgi:hypothetical protein